MNTAFSNATAFGIVQSGFATVFGRAGGVTIIVGDRPTDQSYEVVNGITLYLNLTVVNGTADNLQTKLTAAVTAMYNTV